jgi:hypothetical protein
MIDIKKWDKAFYRRSKEEIISGIERCIENHKNVMTSFTWSMTPQGQYFWNAYYDKGDDEGKMILYSLLDYYGGGKPTIEECF